MIFTLWIIINMLLRLPLHQIIQMCMVGSTTIPFPIGLEFMWQIYNLTASKTGLMHFWLIDQALITTNGLS